MSNKKGFTLLELVIAIGIIGVGLIAVFMVLTSGFSTMSQARGQVVAINLAREGAEIVFNLRDTNLRKWSGKKDLCWLNKKSVYAADPEQCENEVRIGYYDGGTGASYLPLMTAYGESKVPALISLFPGQLDIFDNNLSLADRSYELTLSSSGEFMPAPFFSGSVYNTACMTLNNTFSPEIGVDCEGVRYSPAGRFYRSINRIGLYDKDPMVSGGNNMQCEQGGLNDTISGDPCGSSTAKELRFCSEVQYIVDQAKRKVIICSLMTNFKE